MQRIATIATIVTQHVEDAAFLWSRRRREIDGQILGEIDIGRIDQRLDANLEGLFASGEAAWKLAVARFSDYAEPAELFVMGALAFHWGDGTAISATLEAAASIGEGGIQGLSGAIARMPYERLRPHVGKWLDAKEPLLLSLGLSAVWHCRVDLGVRLNDLIANDDIGVRTRAIRLAGAIKRRDLLPAILKALDANDSDERLTAACAACVLGEALSAYPALDKLARLEPAIATQAFKMRLLATPGKAGKSWLQERLDQSSLHAQAIAAIGLFGDRSIMPWLIEKMREPDLAYSSGLALRDLFEVDFNDTDVFTIDPPSLGEKFHQIEDYPLPVADKVETWWDKGRGPDKHERFLSMCRLKLDAYRAALANPFAPLVDWRRTRQFPAWM
ncbi:hypothetical protein LB533_15280 [Mesorhizobium sp. BR1-1-13]|uniref:hypothetical protein n=1 Tax=Mesorhizobium sp. BR1-1-13 TaxID=2876656 RepID=UPI001CD10DAF|nr:hypothetical protein [Mesorhizobium sp. BR1-1-13]MBZ9942456.1 hypothetical protein [Mesorhizobium sp. BR1-1-13]